MRRLMPLLAVFCWALAGVASAQQALADRQGSRLAFVVTAESYENAGQLRNPGRDGESFNGLLRDLGFEVTSVRDADLAAMRRGSLRFGQEAEEADYVLVFFAGHGVSLRRESRLLPTDASLASERDVVLSSVALADLMALAGNAKVLGMVFVDACRNDPRLPPAEGGRGVRILGDGAEVGLGPDVPTDAELESLGTTFSGGGSYFVGLSTAAGHVAVDGTGLNSPFTAALVAAIATGGSAEDIAGKVVDSVVRATNGHQRPVFRIWGN